MLVEILEVRTQQVLVKNVETTEEFNMETKGFDKFSLRPTVQFETDGISIPYSMSAQRRADIREHHNEEARCGNI